MDQLLVMPWNLPWHLGWPIYCGALVGVFGTAVAGGRRWAARPASWTATAIAVSATLAFLGLLWVHDSFRAVGRVGVLEHLGATWSPATQFLSNEHFNALATLWRLAWILPAIALVSAALAAVLRLNRRGGTAGSP